jgi:hypothetical protein
MMLKLALLVTRIVSQFMLMIGTDIHVLKCSIKASVAHGRASWLVDRYACFRCVTTFKCLSEKPSLLMFYEDTITFG